MRKVLAKQEHQHLLMLERQERFNTLLLWFLEEGRALGYARQLRPHQLSPSRKRPCRRSSAATNGARLSR